MPEKIEIDIAGKYRVRVGYGVDGLALRRVLDVLERDGATSLTQQVVDRFVHEVTDTRLELELVGDVPSDGAVREAVQRRQLLLEAFPDSAAAQAIAAAADRLAQ